MFYVGQKVVCIRNKQYEHMLTMNNVYVVSHVFHGVCGPALCVQGVGGWIGSTPPGWPNSWFRPAVERKTDTGMSILKKLLNTRELVS